MTRIVNCVVLNREAEGLDAPPHPGSLGERIYENVSKEGWQQWVAHSTMLINEYRLEAGTPEAMKVWLTELEKFFFGEGSELPNEYVPPDDASKK